jgi:hypothetical protein
MLWHLWLAIRYREGRRQYCDICGAYSLVAFRTRHLCTSCKEEQ